VEVALTNLKEAQKSQDIDQLDKAMAEINTAWQAASEEMYKASQSQGAPEPDSSQAGPGTGKSPGDEVTDVDFEEVK
jgi:molecular chaperone DnaK